MPLLGTVPIPSAESWPHLLASVLIHGVYFTLVALVASLRETSMVFALLIGAVFLNERVSPAKVLAVCLIAAGAVYLKLA